MFVSDDNFYPSSYDGTAKVPALSIGVGDQYMATSGLIIITKIHSRDDKRMILDFTYDGTLHAEYSCPVNGDWDMVPTCYLIEEMFEP